MSDEPRFQETQSAAVDLDVAPGRPELVVAFEPPRGLVSEPELWIAATGGAGEWGGAQVFVSEDDDDYRHGWIGQLPQGMTMGRLLDPLPACNALGWSETPWRVRLEGPGRELPSRAVDEALARVSLCLVTEPDELVAYTATRLLEADDTGCTYQVSGGLVRGCYGTRERATWWCPEHPEGAAFVKLDRLVFRYAYEPRMVGRPLFFKPADQNVYGGEPRNLRGVEPLVVRVQGRFFDEDPRRSW